MRRHLPNLLTVARALAVPVLVAAFWLDGPARLAAPLLFLLASATDWLDGRLARAWDVHSAFGRWLDPVADKLLVAAALVMLAAAGLASAAAVAAIVARELLVSGLREYMAEAGLGLPVSRLAKWKTAAQMLAVGLLLVAWARPGMPWLVHIGTVALWLAVALTLQTGWAYLSTGLRHMRAADAAGRRAI